MVILVTGGTGFIGSHLVDTLVSKGEDIRVLVRETSKVEKLKNLGVDFVYGDVTDKNTLKGIARDVDVVYHLAGKVGEWGVPDSEFIKINIKGTENILNASLEAEINHFIFCSTPGVLGLTGYPEAKEDLPYNPHGIYEKTKCEAEKLAIRFYEEKGLPMTIIRPDFVYGPGDLRRLKLYKAIKNKSFLMIGNGRSFLHPTYIDDVICGFELVMNNSKAIGEVYNIAGPRPITVREYLETIAQALNVTISKFKVPKVFARGAAFVLENISKVSKKEPFVSQSKINFLTISHGSDISKIKTQLGYLPKVEFKDGIKRTMDWYIENNVLSKK